MSSDAQGASSDANSQANQSTAGGEGSGEEGLTLEKVAAITKEQTGFDLEAAIKQAATEAAKAAAAEAGQKAQKTFGGQLQSLKDALASANERADKVSREARLREINAMPPEQRKAAEALLGSEEAARKVHDMYEGLKSTAKELTAERMSLDLAKVGLDVPSEEFSDCETPEAMVAKAATLRAEAAEKKHATAEAALKEALAGAGTPPAKPGAGQRPPAGSQPPAKSAGGGAQGTAGEKAWSQFKGKGLDFLGQALKTIEPGAAP